MKRASARTNNSRLASAALGPNSLHYASKPGGVTVVACPQVVTTCGAASGLVAKVAIGLF